MCMVGRTVLRRDCNLESSNRALIIMETFKIKLSRATALDTREILGAIGLVVDREGNSRFGGKHLVSS